MQSRLDFGTIQPNMKQPTMEQPAMKPDSQEIGIYQLNAWIKEDIEKVAKEIRKTGAQIVCLQELTQGFPEQSHDDTIEYIQRKLGFYGVWQSIPIDDPELGHWHQANAIFSRFPMSLPRKHWLHKPTSQTDQHRGYIEADVWVPGGELTVATSHMSFKDLSEGRQDEVDQDVDDHELKKLLAITAHRDQNFIIGLDTNEDPDSPRVRAIAERFRHVGPDFSLNTWPTKPQEFPGFEDGEPKRRIDYLFATPDIRVKEAELVESDVSDHLGIVATFMLDAA